MEVLKWLKGHDPFCPWGYACDAAAGGGQLEVLKWLRSQNPPCPWSMDTCHQAARAGHLELATWTS